jgi:hypothetical protein
MKKSKIKQISGQHELEMLWARLDNLQTQIHLLRVTKKDKRKPIKLWFTEGDIVKSWHFNAICAATIILSVAVLFLLFG